MARWKRDVIIGVIFELVFAFAYRESLKISVGTMRDIKAAQPGVYVRLWLIVFAVLNLLLIIKSLKEKDETVVPKLFHKQAVITLVLVAFYTFIMKYVGYFVGTLLFLIATLIDYSYAAGKFKDDNGNPLKGKALIKPIAIYVLIAIVTTIATYYLFGTVLSVKLPEWKLFV